MRMLSKVLVGLLFSILLSAPSFAQLEEISVAASSSAEVDRHGVCKVVTNLHDTLALYVPSMTASEWESFISAPPYRVIDECKKCSGYARDGYCFYAGAHNATCNATCAVRGGVNAAGMNRLVDYSTLVSDIESPGLVGGSVQLAGGTGSTMRTFCQRVMQVLLGGPADNVSGQGFGGPYGCHAYYYGDGPALGIDVTWNANVAHTAQNSRHICACNR